MKIAKLAALVLTLALVQSVICYAEEESEGEDSQIPINTRATAEAWTAFRTKDYAEAIEKADECIARYQPAADKIEAILEAQKAGLPTGAVSETDRERIVRYGILHDVAACLLIKAWVAEQQGRKDEAIKAYEKVQQYTYARITERAGEPYWSPAELATQQLQKLSQ